MTKQNENKSAGRAAAARRADKRAPKGAAKPTVSKALAQEHAKSPLAPTRFASLPPMAGVRLATGQAGIKYRDRTDVLMVVMAPGTTVAGVMT